ncbi:MAG TPA: hypothetical protein DCY54_00175 [Parachlamydiales bacterium]|nr:MAG: hypothetical protein A2Z85_04640 [Chlamydiae bacterium GWA2_50_15]HAZ15062.1 hypothetical protein [Parachlamydiales bacterium]
MNFNVAAIGSVWQTLGQYASSMSTSLSKAALATAQFAKNWFPCCFSYLSSHPTIAIGSVCGLALTGFAVALFRSYFNNKPNVEQPVAT